MKMPKHAEDLLPATHFTPLFVQHIQEDMQPVQLLISEMCVAASHAVLQYLLAAELDRYKAA